MLYEVITIQSSVPSNIYLERDIPNINQIVPISRVNLEIIIFNLVTNSIDALEHKKEAKISVKLRSDEIKDRITSYNVCYTKLLRPLVLNNIKNAAKAIANLINLIFLLVRFFIFSPPFLRKLSF